MHHQTHLSHIVHCDILGREKVHSENRNIEKTHELAYSRACGLRAHVLENVYVLSDPKLCDKIAKEYCAQLNTLCVQYAPRSAPTFVDLKKQNWDIQITNRRQLSGYLLTTSTRATFETRYLAQRLRHSILLRECIHIP